MSAALLKSAISCVRALQKHDIADDSLFRNPQNSSLASSMSLLSNVANFIEGSVKNCAQLFDVEILILCRVKKQEDRVGRIKDEHFVLWNTMVSPSPTSGPPKVTATEGYDGRTSHDGMAEYPRESHGTENNDVALHSEHLRSEDMAIQQTNRAQAPVGDANPVLAVRNNSSVNHHMIPVSVASECLNFLLDASGFSSHKNCFQQSSYNNVGSKILVEALKLVLEAESKQRKRKGNDQTQSNSSAPISSDSLQQRQGKSDIIYMDLLPDHLRSCPSAGTEVFAIVPMIKRACRRKPSVSRKVKVSLNIRKPDRNKKNQNFAVLCVLLHFKGQNGTCAKVLRDYAREGLSSKGCRRLMKFCASPNTNCGGSDNCGALKRITCKFFDDKKNEIGQGTVDPLLTELEGKKLNEDEIVVRFGKVENLQSQEISPYAERVFRRLKEEPEVQMIWKKSFISRVALHVGFGSKVATAILVEDCIPEEVGTSLSKSAAKKYRTEHKLDVKKAVVVCDIQPVHGIPGNIRYPYAEWYSISSLSNLKTAHFGSQAVPDHLMDVDVRSIPSLLWHKDMCKVDGTIDMVK